MHASVNALMPKMPIICLLLMTLAVATIQSSSYDRTVEQVPVVSVFCVAEKAFQVLTCCQINTGGIDLLEYSKV